MPGILRTLADKLADRASDGAKRYRDAVLANRDTDSILGAGTAIGVAPSDMVDDVNGIELHNQASEGLVPEGKLRDLEADVTRADAALQAARKRAERAQSEADQAFAGFREQQVRLEAATESNARIRRRLRDIERRHPRIWPDAQATPTASPAPQSVYRIPDSPKPEPPQVKQKLGDLGLSRPVADGSPV